MSSGDRVRGTSKIAALRIALTASAAVIVAPAAFAQHANVAPVLGSAGALAGGAASTGVEISVTTVAPQKPPADAQKRTASVLRVKIEGGFLELESQTSALAAEVENRRVTLLQAYEFATRVQRIYLAAGYPLVNAILEPSAFANGEVRVKIIDGFIEEIDVSSVPEELRGLIRARLNPIVGRRHLSKAQLQRQILLIYQLPGVAGSTSTRLGRQIGGVVLDVKATQTPVSVVSSVNNYLPEPYGTFLFSHGFSVNNALGFGENLHASFSSSDDFGRILAGRAKSQAFSVGGYAPIGADGLTFGLGYAQSRVSPLSTPGEFPGYPASEAAREELQRVSARANYPLFLTTEQSLHLQIGVDFVDSFSNVGPAPNAIVSGQPVFSLFHDQYEDLRLGGEWHVSFPWSWGGNSIAALVYERGLNGLGGSAFEPLSRPGATPEFNKLYGEVRVQQPLPDSFVISALGRAQSSFGRSLMQSEELQLAGPDALSGFGLGSVFVDSGAVGRVELQHPFNVRFNDVTALATPYVFGAFGGGSFAQVSAGQDSNVRASSLGLGARINANLFNWPSQETINLEVARLDSNVPGARQGYYFTFGLQTAYAGDFFGRPDVGLTRVVDQRSTNFSASGFYAGLNSGYAFDASPRISTSGSVVSNAADMVYGANAAAVSAASLTGGNPASGDTPIGGAQIGYNSIRNSWLIGGEADIQGAGQTSVSRSVRTATATVGLDPQPMTSMIDGSKSVDWLGTLRGRVGMAATPNVLGYFTAGLAYGGATADTRVMQSWNDTALHTPFGATASSSVANGRLSTTLLGFTIGGGLEWMFAPGLSLKGEYLYYDLGDARFSTGALVTAPVGGLAGSNVATSQASARFSGHILRLGLNYHLGEPDAERAFVASASGEKSKPVWNGAYAGVNAGYDWGVNAHAANGANVGSTALDQQLGAPLSSLLAAAVSGGSTAAPKGFIGGGQFGYNIQIDRGVVGLEADIQGAGARGRGAYTGSGTLSTVAPPAVIAADATRVNNLTALDWLGTLRGRIGLLVRPDLLAFTTGGLAYGGTNSTTYVNPMWSGGTPAAPKTSGAIGMGGAVLPGWTIGGGLEWLFSRNLSLKAEYLFYDLGVARYGGSPVSLAAAGFSDTALPSTTVRYDGQIVKLGLNYHFD